MPPWADFCLDAHLRGGNDSPVLFRHLYSPFFTLLCFVQLRTFYGASAFSRLVITPMVVTPAARQSSMMPTTRP